MHAGVFDLAESSRCSQFRFVGVAFRLWVRRRHSDFWELRGSTPCLHVPLSTLRVQPCDWSRAWLRVGVGCWPFTVRLFHPHLHAGLSRRTPKHLCDL